MQSGSAVEIVGTVVLLAIFFADLFFDVIYRKLGWRLLVRLSRGSYPTGEPTGWASLVCSVVGFLVIVGGLFVLLAIVQLTEA